MVLNGVPKEVELDRPLSQGMILQTSAPCEAVLLIRKPEDYYDEGEVVVDPYRLGRVRVVETRVPGAPIHGARDRSDSSERDRR